MRKPSAVAAARPMRTIERGLNSKANSSTPNRVAATGVPNTALMPAAAPATSSARRWAAVRWKSWPTMEPTAPPVKMIGPSAPKGPPVPMLMALEIGFRMARRGCDPAAVDQDALHGLWDAVATDLLGAESGHQADDQTTADGDDDGDGTERVGVGRDQMDAEALVVEEVGEEPDHVEQGQRDAGSDDADQNRQRHEPQDGGSGREVPECPLACVSSTVIATVEGLGRRPGRNESSPYRPLGRH